MSDMINLVEARMKAVAKQIAEPMDAEYDRLKELGYTDREINYYMNRAMRDATPGLHGFGKSPKDWPFKLEDGERDIEEEQIRRLIRTLIEDAK